VDVDTGLVVIEPAGSLLEAEPALRGARLQARTAREGELIVAIAVRKEQS
jgi:hypothetical protein